MGGQAVTAPHVDEKNLVHPGVQLQPWVTLTWALILWVFSLAVKFPPGSTILIPSALLVH